MSEPGNLPQAPRPQEDKGVDFCPGDEAEKRDECTDAASGRTA